ncbi:hypothetical protein ACSNOI_17720 [Actinomadura kijaniata]|uniref:hypothetical protein n=1 Tax=Actinomadura kijaniata TaxID=46161 RepID=UPI003F1C86BA
MGPIATVGKRPRSSSRDSSAEPYAGPRTGHATPVDPGPAERVPYPARQYTEQPHMLDDLRATEVTARTRLDAYLERTS